MQILVDPVSVENRLSLCFLQASPFLCITLGVQERLQRGMFARTESSVAL